MNNCCNTGELYCAEMVLSKVSAQMGIDSPLIPRIATGLCSGMSRTQGPCGALTGGVLALNLCYGRDTARESVEKNYQAVQILISKFEKQFHSCACSELLGCNLATNEGQQQFKEKGLAQRCQTYMNFTIETVGGLIEK